MVARVPLLLFVLVGLAAARLHNLREGEDCYTKSGDQGICIKARRCPGIISRVRHGMKIRMCSYGNSGPIICCRSSAFVEKARAKCEDYGKHVYVEEIVQTLTFATEKYLTPKCHMVVQALVFGGEKASLMQFPHMAALGFGEEEAEVEWVCGGSLISDRFILTAAHCVYRGSENIGWVRLGDLNLVRSNDSAQPQTFRVTKIITHPDYRPPSKYHDVALLRMDHSADMGEVVRPACLYTEPHNPQVDVATATGWGVTEHSNGAYSNDLMYVGLKFQDFQSCKQAYGKIKFLLDEGVQDESMLCAGDPKEGKDTCIGDSGGPLQIRLNTPYCMYAIVGVTSFGDDKCGSGTAVYTRVSKYIPWIVSVVWP